MNIDWMVIICTVAVVAMAFIAFCFEYGIGVKKDDKDKMQEKQDDSSMKDTMKDTKKVND